jgi:hypothetical protein
LSLQIKHQEILLQFWEAQLGTGMRVMETIMEGATNIREAQFQFGWRCA